MECKGNHKQGYCFYVDLKLDLFVAYCDHCGYRSETKWSEVLKRITHL